MSSMAGSVASPHVRQQNGDKQMSQKKNPFRLPYLKIAVICCVALSVLFYIISYTDGQKALRLNDQKKAELMVQDLDTQLSLFQDMALRLMIDNQYQPRYFRESKYNEYTLVHAFAKERFYATLSDQAFLYYGGDTLFVSAGATSSLSIYLHENSPEKAKQLATLLREIQQVPIYAAQNVRFFPTEQILYVLLPLRVSEYNSPATAVLGFAIKQELLLRRFQIVSGGFSGRVSLWAVDDLLFSSENEPVQPDQKGVLEAQGSCFRLMLSPAHRSIPYGPSLPFWIFMGLANLLLIFWIPSLFAERSYRPIREISNKYSQHLSLPQESSGGNALEEIDRMMDFLLKSNSTIRQQAKSIEMLLRGQVLRLLLEGSSSVSAERYLKKLDMDLPGPYYFVTSCAYENVDESTLENIRQAIEAKSDPHEGIYLYSVCYADRKCLVVIASIPVEEKKKIVEDIIAQTAIIMKAHPLICSGSLYDTQARISASFLESMEKLRQGFEDVHAQEREIGQSFSEFQEDIWRIGSLLKQGDEQGALEGLAHSEENIHSASLLMQQYFYTQFVSEITSLAREKHIKLPLESISVITSARSETAFSLAAHDLICEFAASVRSQRQDQAQDVSLRICEYIDTHFAEYDLSIEMVAKALSVSTADVRQATLTHRNKLYKDYLIQLRINEAKRLLLCDEQLTVDDICRRVGYCSTSYFIKLFKKITGMTPTYFRISGDISKEEEP